MLTEKRIKELEKFAIQVRIETIREIGTLGVGHIGGSLSICDVLSVLYGEEMRVDPKNPMWEDRDWLVLSKGHSGPALYATLALKGFFPMKELETLNRLGTNLPSHCDMNRTPGIDMTTGSLGQGSSSAMGIALGNKRSGKKSYTYLILGDGEIQEGQVWEAALFANQFKLNNVIAFVDYNKQQIDGFINEINDLGDISKKFESFGWFSQCVDGHDVAQIYNAIENAKAQKEKPSMIVLNTIKGKGWTEIEGKLSNHSMSITKEQMESAIKKLEEEMKSMDD